MPMGTMLINTNADALAADHFKAVFEIEMQVEGKVTHLRSFVEGWKASEKQVEEVERQVEDNLEGIRKATIAQMRVINFFLLHKIHNIDNDLCPEPESIPSRVQLKAGGNLNSGFKT